MDRLIIIATSQVDYNVVTLRLKEGWILDPELKTIRLDDSVVYHLIKYSEEEMTVLQEQTEERIASIKSVNIEEADEYLKQGYEIKDTYAKTVTIIKKEVKKK